MRAESPDELIRVLVADDTRLHTQLLADALARNAAIQAIAAAPQDLLEQRRLPEVDVFLISSDLDMQPAHGFEVLRQMRSVQPNLRAIILLDSSKPHLILEAFRAGARGVVSRQESVETLSKCVRRVHQGQIWANSEQMDLVVQTMVSARNLTDWNAPGMEQLSKRELEVVGCVAQGLSNREIADRLGLSQHTVKNYLFRVFEKLGVSSRVELLSITMSRMGKLDAASASPWKESKDRIHLSDAALADCRRAAEDGMPIAQIELARFHFARRASSEDVVQAYKWYLVAGQQIARTGKVVGKAMTTEQILQAEEQAADWLKNSQRPGPSSSAAAGPVLPAKIGPPQPAADPRQRKTSTLRSMNPPPPSARRLP